MSIRITRIQNDEQDLYNKNNNKNKNKRVHIL